MSDINTGGPAFPAVNHHGHKLTGMTLRDYFAAKALQGLLASKVCAPSEEFCKRSYEMADHMLRARSA